MRLYPIPFFCSLLVAVSAPASLSINEALPMPGPLSPCTASVWAGEYIELCNNSPFPEEATGYRIGTDGEPGSPLTALSAITLIPPGGFALIIPAASAPLWEAILPGTPLYTDGKSRLCGYGLRDSGMRLLLKDPSGIPLSTLTWTEEPGRDTSLERIRPEAPDRSGNWHPNPWGGTPGKQNRTVAVDGEGERFRLLNKGCRPERGIPLTMRVTLKDGESARIEVLTLRGRTITTVTEIAELPGTVQIPWYGTGSDGRLLRRGCYLLRILIFRGGRVRFITVRPAILVRE